MQSEGNKFYIIGACGGSTPFTEDLFYHWGVIHTSLFLGSKEGGFAFTENHKDALRASYATFANLETSHSVYAVERIELDFTDENPSIKTPKPVFFTDCDSCEYKMMRDDWKVAEPCYNLLEGTKWSAASKELEDERETNKQTKALDPDVKWG
ncbi:hypothetical protein ACHAQH_005897 [Verticillium albo-atrum]